VHSLWFEPDPTTAVDVSCRRRARALASSRDFAAAVGWPREQQALSTPRVALLVLAMRTVMVVVISFNLSAGLFAVWLTVAATLMVEGWYPPGACSPGLPTQAHAACTCISSCDHRSPRAGRLDAAPPTAQRLRRRVPRSQ
jgi:hypothetical protein